MLEAASGVTHGAFCLAFALFLPLGARADETHTYRDGLDGYGGTQAVNISSLGLTASGSGMNGTTFDDGGDWCIGDLPQTFGYDISPLIRFTGLMQVPGSHANASAMSVPLASTGAQTVDIPLDPAIVSEWFADPSANHGVVLRVDAPNHHVGLVPPLSTKAAERPTLVLTFVPGDAPPPTDAGAEADRSVETPAPPDTPSGGCGAQRGTGAGGTFTSFVIALLLSRAARRRA